jgi:hypothetical protein
MKEETSPCKNCIVLACCSEPCNNYANYIYKNKKFENFSKQTISMIKRMKKPQAIKFIIVTSKLRFIIETNDSFLKIDGEDVFAD